MNIFLSSGKHIPHTFQQFIHKLPTLDNHYGPWLAGGSVRKLWQGLPWWSGDVDVFFSSREQYESWSNHFRNLPRPDIDLEHLRAHMVRDWQEDWFSTEKPIAKPKGDILRVHERMVSDNAESLVLSGACRQLNEIKLQLVHKWFPKDLQQLFDHFDITVCQFATTGTGIWCTSQAAQHCEERKLHFHDWARSHSPTMRVLKYMMYGFEPTAQTLLQCADLIVAGDVACDQY